MGTLAVEEKQVAGKPGKLVEMNWDPITRIVGSLGIFTKIDFGTRRVAECHSTSSIFRGYSIFMKGKDPRNSHFITSRICGICGDNHATCATYAQNMAFGVKPPPIAEWIVNLGEAAEYMFDHNIFQDNLVGVDFCEKMVKETNPGVWEKALKTESPHAGIHGYRTISDIMTALNPFTGAFYLEALQMSRMTREMFCLMEGRYVQPSRLSISIAAAMPRSLPSRRTGCAGRNPRASNALLRARLCEQFPNRKGQRHEARAGLCFCDFPSGHRTSPPSAERPVYRHGDGGDTPPVIRAGLLQSTLIVLPAEEKVANVFAGDTVDRVFDGGHVASRFISVKPKVANGSTDTTYKVDVEAIGLKVKREFAMKKKAKQPQKLVTKAVPQKARKSA
jgi:Nickel-dependent hydrogenase